MKRVIVIMFASVLCGFGVSANLPEPATVQDRVESTSSKFMARKLDYSRDIVEGLSTEDYTKISKAAQDLMLLSQDADWRVVTTPEYLKASAQFRETVTRLREAGRAQNLDGAALAYFEVTLNCVRCHQRLRVKSDTK